MSELKPCPFCGGEGSLQYRSGLETVACKGCDAEFYGFVSSQEAIAAWNRRADGWISTKERLPDGEYDVLVFCTNGFVYTDNFSQDSGWAMVSGVTHWMPLPSAPPKEKEE